MEGDLSGVAEMFGQAPLDPPIWPRALEGFAHLAGGFGAQLLGVSQGRLILNIGGGMPLEAMAALALAWATETANGVQPPSPFTADDIERQPAWRAFVDKVGAAHASVMLIGADEGITLFAAVLRARQPGSRAAAQQEATAALIPHILTAARTQMMLERQSAAITLAALERLSVSMVVCDAFGRVVAASPEGAKLLAGRLLLTDRGGRLSAAHQRSDRDLQAAIAAAGAVGLASGLEPSPVFLASLDGRQVASANVRPLHSGVNAIAVPGRVMVVVGGLSASSADGLLAHLGLTQAEADVAGALADGEAPIAIARRRQVSIATVRAQIRTIFGKLDVSRVSELIMKVRVFQ